MVQGKGAMAFVVCELEGQRDVLGDRCSRGARLTANCHGLAKVPWQYMRSIFEVDR